ncbi:MAG: aspartyl protease family protein [Acidimicrobiia bacterium]|nr:aspartyl protease family protein [Acidimicrobiia bacterium]
MADHAPIMTDESPQHLATELTTRLAADRMRLASAEYLQGRYDAAISRLMPLIAESALHPVRRSRARQLLSLAYYQANRFAEASELPLRDPLSRLMRSATGPPNRIKWNNAGVVELPFLQTEPWQLPSVAVTVGGRQLTARIDTGGDLFSLPWSLADTLGIVPAATSSGRFAGGRRAKIGYGIAPRLELGGAAIEQVPVSINSFAHPVIGTGLLRQFRATLDFPESRLVLRLRTDDPISGGFPFVLAGTHFLVARGAVTGWPTYLLVDSGLEATTGAGFVAPDSTLHAAGIEIPAARPVEGMSGAGQTKLAVGEFSVPALSLGNRTRSDVPGLTGIFPRQLARKRTLGFPIGGLVSHNFLRHYRWTLDFDRMRMHLAAS